MQAARRSDRLASGGSHLLLPRVARHRNTPAVTAAIVSCLCRVSPLVEHARVARDDRLGALCMSAPSARDRLCRAHL